jgi:hypothetical protein
MWFSTVSKGWKKKEDIREIGGVMKKSVLLLSAYNRSGCFDD